MRFSGSQEKIDTKDFKTRAAQFHGKMKEVDLAELPGHARRGAVVAYRFSLLLVDQVINTELARRASALTYTTILSIFPVLAIISFTASFFLTQEKEVEAMAWVQEQFLPTIGDEDDLQFPMTAQEMELREQQKKFTDNVQNLITGASQKFRENAAGVGVFGFIGLLLTCGILYYSIETTVNEVWQVTHRGTWFQTFTNFVTILIAAPIIIGISIAATGLAVAIFDEEAAIQVEQQNGDLPAASGAEAAPVEEGGIEAPPEETPPEDAVVYVETNGETTSVSSIEARVPSGYEKLIQKARIITTSFGFVLPMIPMLVNALVLSTAFTFIPRTKVKFTYAVAGGLVASILWEVARYMFFYYVYSSVVNRTLADVLGISVIFLIWIYITWIILLIGNLVVYVSQNYSELWGEKMMREKTLLDGRLLVAMMVLLARRFEEHGGGYTDHELRARLGLPQKPFLELINKLLKRNYVTALENDGFQIGRPAEQIMVRDLMELGCDLSTLPVSLRGPIKIRTAFDFFQSRTLELVKDSTLEDILGYVEEGKIEGEEEETERADA